MLDHPLDIGPYQITSLLGRGGYTEVLRGIHPDRREPVAIKRLRVDLPEGSERYKKRLMAEGRLVSKLKNPHLPRLHRLSYYGGEPQLILDYVPGEELGALLSRHPGVGLPPLYVAEIIRQILKGLSFLHSLGPGFVHQDLKPSNVLLSPMGQVTVIDLGIAAPVGRPLHRIRQGTPGYRSPEQVAGAPALGRASDLFSVAILWVELCSGLRLFPPSLCHDLEKIGRIHSALPAYLTNRLGVLPPGIRPLVETMLRRMPKDRPQRAELVEAQVVAWLAENDGAKGYEEWCRNTIVQDQTEVLQPWAKPTADGRSGLIHGPQGAQAPIRAAW